MEEVIGGADIFLSESMFLLAASRCICFTLVSIEKLPVSRSQRSDKQIKY